MKLKSLIFTLFLVISAFSISAQTTVFTYQGRLMDGAATANGTYQIQFSLYDALSGGTQLGTTITNNSVSVTNGVFTVPLDFSETPFATGADRWIEIAVRKAADPPGFNTLTPRQQLTSAPYAVHARQSFNADNANNASNLGSLPANQYVVTTDPRMTDARSPTAGSPNYIQNGTAQQLSSNFNVSGTGTADIFKAATQFNIGISRVLSAQGNGSNFFAGIGAGVSNTTGDSNAFFGTDAGSVNTQGRQNSYFGYGAGRANITGMRNAFFGTTAGSLSTSNDNSFFGTNAGSTTTTGVANSFFGLGSGTGNVGGDYNTAIGYGAGFGGSGTSEGTAIGAFARVDANNAIVLGGITGINNGLDTNVGIGTTAPQYRLDVRTGSGFGIYGRSGSGNPIGVAGVSVNPSSNFSAAFVGGAGVWGNTTNQVGVYGTSDSNYGVAAVSSTGGGLYARSITSGNAAVLDGTVQVNLLGTSGATAVCRNASNQLSFCSSSLRYKTNVNPFGVGLNLVKKLSPITFDWKEGGMHDLGLGAEEVAAVEPLLVTYNKDGQVEGVKYDRIGVVLVNAVKEQQAQIEAQKAEIESLKTAICEMNPASNVCKK